MAINPELQKYLDGEIGLDALSPAMRAEADRLSAAFASFHDDHVHAPSWLENRIMVSLPPAPRAPWHQRMLAFVLRPRTVRIRPISLGLAGAVAVLALMLPGRTPIREQGSGADIGGDPQVVAGTVQNPVIYVQFVFAAGAESRSVSIAGDFNGWEPGSIEMRDPDGDGVWTALVGLNPGVHKYMFVVDGKTWVTDPNADRHVDDGFGMRNAVLSVAAQT